MEVRTSSMVPYLSGFNPFINDLDSAFGRFAAAAEDFDH